ncbi:MAG: hypothetical protein ACP5VR_07445 [Acidimicrobiales bacterium]
MVNRRPKGIPTGGQVVPTGGPEAASLHLEEHSAPPGADRQLLGRVLESAAKLQRVVPDAVLVGGSAAALWANHRDSLDHDHVLADLEERFDAVLEAVEATDGWVTNRVEPGKLILGELGGIETGVRQLIRKVPLEVTNVELPSGERVRVPTPDEILRVKAYLIVRRNQTRDYLDVVALAERCGLEHAASVLAGIDAYYGDQRVAGADAEGVATQLARQLSDPRPRDARATTQLNRYKGLDARWVNWADVVGFCKQLALKMVEAG